jgi:hypothetical protein
MIGSIILTSVTLHGCLVHDVLTDGYQTVNSSIERRSPLPAVNLYPARHGAHSLLRYPGRLVAGTWMICSIQSALVFEVVRMVPDLAGVLDFPCGADYALTAYSSRWMAPGR